MTIKFRQKAVRSIRQLVESYRTATISPTEIVEDYLARIDSVSPECGPIFVTVTDSRARHEGGQSTHRYAAGKPRGECDGVPLVWKDVFDIAGTCTTAGTNFLRLPQARKDAVAVAKVRAAGGICLGKTQCSELAYSVLGENEAVGTPRNPCGNVQQSLPGGSSSGAAVAVARGLASASIGTDSGGSVRLPAAWCGLTGFKPSRNTIATEGSLQFSPSLDTVGLITNGVEDAKILLDAMAVHSRNRSINPRRPTLIVPRLPNSVSLSPQVKDAFDRVVSHLGRRGIRIELTDYPILDEMYQFQRRYGSIAMLEGWELWKSAVQRAGHQASYRLRQQFDSAPRQSVSRCKHDRRRALLIQDNNKHLRHDRYLILPSSPITAPSIKEVLGSNDLYNITYETSHAFLWPFNVLDAPSITIPCGSSEDGLPIGLLVVAAQNRDNALLCVAANLETEITKIFTICK